MASVNIFQDAVSQSNSDTKKDVVIHPGVWLRRNLFGSDTNPLRGPTPGQFGAVKALAAKLGIARPYMSDILRGAVPISKHVARNLAILTKTTTAHWLVWQAEYDAMVYDQSFEADGK